MTRSITDAIGLNFRGNIMFFLHQHMLMVREIVVDRKIDRQTQLFLVFKWKIMDFELQNICIKIISTLVSIIFKNLWVNLELQELLNNVIKQPFLPFQILQLMEIATNSMFILKCCFKIKRNILKIARVALYSNFKYYNRTLKRKVPIHLILAFSP